jgi:hypothetical protein
MATSFTLKFSSLGKQSSRGLAVQHFELLANPDHKIVQQHRHALTINVARMTLENLVGKNDVFE